jgi:hypothetical protein
MSRRYLAGILYAVCTIGVLTSCGGSKAPGTAELATVYATVTPPAGADIDVATWVDATTGSKAPACGSNSVPTIAPDDLSFIITSTAYTAPNTGQTSTIVPSNLLVQSITLSFTPANSDSPLLPAIYQTQFPSAGQVIKVGDNTIPVRVATHELKSFFMTGLGNQSINCSNGAMYSYWVTAAFNVFEISTGRTATIYNQGPLLIHVADFADK